MVQVLPGKQTIYRPFEGPISLSQTIASILVRIVKFQVPFIYMDSTFGPMVPHFKCIKDGS